VMIGMAPSISFPVHFGSGLTISLVVLLTFVLPTSAEAAKLSRFLTSHDLAGRLVLDQNGQQVVLPSAEDRHPESVKGSIPTYLAIPLRGGEHLPNSIPTLETGSQQGQNPVGPLNFDSLVKTNLDATLAKSKLAVVDTSSQNYLVEFLPRRTHSTQSSKPGAGSTISELSNLLSTGSNQLNKLTQSGMSELEKFLHISSKTPTLTPSLNLEAQVFNGDVTPAAIPEPATWMIFVGLIVSAVVFRKGRLVRA
jgi:hypothetical protein